MFNTSNVKRFFFKKNLYPATNQDLRHRCVTAETVATSQRAGLQSQAAVTLSEEESRGHLLALPAEWQR